MKTALDQLANEYRGAMRDYLAGAGESALRRAYELGRLALAEGIGVLEMTHLHQQCVAELLDAETPDSSAGELRLHALNFFAEGLSAFEMALRGYQEANAKLRRSLEELVETQNQLHLQNERLAAANRAVEAERRRYQELFEFAPDAYLATGLDGTIQQANTAAAALLQQPKSALPGQSLMAFVAEEDQAQFNAELDRFRSATLEKREEWQVSVRTADRGPVPAELTVAPEYSGDGVLVGLRWLIRDVTERKRAEEERAQILVGYVEAEAAQRFEFLAEASSLLASSLDYETTLADVARLTVGYLADWCFIHDFDPDGSVRLLAGVPSKAADLALSDETRELFRPQRRKHPGLFHTILRPEIVDPVSERWLEQFCDGPELVARFRELAFRSAMIVPLVVHERIVGTLTLLNSVSGRSYTLNDLALAEDLASRCALALDNACLYREVILERDRAEKASRAKDEFLAILSHELRNPLTPVMGWTRILKNHQLIMQQPELREGVSALERNARLIVRLVGDCLDLARISQGKIQMESEVTDLNHVVKTSAESIAEAAAGKKLTLTKQLSVRPLWICGDPTRLQQVVMNLLLNAVKYTNTGGRIDVRSSECDGEAEVEVRDSGMGIDAGRLELIFQPFTRSTNIWLASESGLGLGLAIARQIVQMHGGRIWAESAGPGLGSTFRARLPLTAAVNLEGGTRVARQDQPEVAEHLRILVIEDSPDVLFLVRVEMEQLGYEVLTATDALQGLALAMQERPDTIISDIKMAGTDGYELIRRIRAIPELTRVPAIALSGFGMQADIEKALLAGYDASVTKPAEPRELDILIKKLTKKQKQIAQFGSSD
jgi:PAS domain S-box-containing protein